MRKDADETRNRLIAEIEIVFGDVQRGSGETLHQAALEGTGSAEETRQARLLDNEMSWREIPDNAIDEHYSALSFLDAEGLRFYLPAFMRYALRHFEHSDSPAIDWAIYSLCDLANDSERFRKRCAVFNGEQSVAIYRFLRFMADHSNGRADETAALRALHEHWGQFREPWRGDCGTENSL